MVSYKNNKKIINRFKNKKKNIWNCKNWRYIFKYICRGYTYFKNKFRFKKI